MGNVRNVSGEDRFPAELGGRLVMPGQVVEVPDDSVYGYTCQDAWEPADEETAAVAGEQEAANAAANPVPDPDIEPEPVDVDDYDDTAPPAGNATRDEWVVWAVTVKKVDVAVLKDMGRDEIRDTYGPASVHLGELVPDEETSDETTDPEGDQPPADDSGDAPQED